MLRAKFRQRLFQQLCLACSGARNHADYIHACIVKSRAKVARKQIILLENILANFNNSRAATHSSTSSETTSSSLPCTISVTDAPHSGQLNHSDASTGWRASHDGQYITTGTSSTTSCDPSSGVSAHAISYEETSASFTTPAS